VTKVRALVGTRKGAFVLTSDGSRKSWDVSGPHFGGWEIYHLSSSPADPDRIYASQSTGWFGQMIQRSDDGGKTWNAVGNEFKYTDDKASHQDYDGTLIPWTFKRVWHLEPTPGDPDTVYAGVEDAAIFKSTDGAKTWQELDGVRTHSTHETWSPGAGGHCLHSILIDPSNPDRIHVAISAAGVLRSQDGGKSWTMGVEGMRAEYAPDPTPPAGYCVHDIAIHPSRPETVFAQEHCHVYRSDDDGAKWTDVGPGRTAEQGFDFGFPIAVHPHEPETIYIVPMKSGEEHYPTDGRLQVLRSRTGGGNWEPLTKGLPQENCYVNVLRDAMSTDSLDKCGVYFGTTGGQVYASPDSGESWTPIVSHLPAVLSVEVQTLA
jgi:photosystem II stability/assembly factor-like uncharacterized protein